MNVEDASGPLAAVTTRRRDDRFGPMVGASPAMREVREVVDRVAPTVAPVLLVGETGTGKNLLAQTIHSLSARSSGPYELLPCAAIPPQRIEAELYGEFGSLPMSGALRHRGVFERASGGTLVLDHITELPMFVQAGIVHVLESGRVMPLGGERSLTTDVRVIATASSDPGRAVREGRLRRDLLDQLTVVTLYLPSLRERARDLDLLAEHFLRLSNERFAKNARLSRAARRSLRAHAWPGNVRELRQVIERAAILADHTIEEDHVSFVWLDAGSPVSSIDTGGRRIELPVGTTLAEAVRAFIHETLLQADGNKRKAAATLGISPKTLYNRLLSDKGAAEES